MHLDLAIKLDAFLALHLHFGFCLARAFDLERRFWLCLRSCLLCWSLHKREVEVKLPHRRAELVPFLILRFLASLFESGLKLLEALPQIFLLSQNRLKSGLDELQSIADTRFQFRW